VTDDVSVIEALGLPVKLTQGLYTNIKLTTPDDMSVAQQVLRERGVEDESDDGRREASSAYAISDSLDKKRSGSRGNAEDGYGCGADQYMASLSGS
jgi:hypothetical protein